MQDNRNGLSTMWTRTKTGEDKKNFEEIVRNNVQLLTRLKEIFQEHEREITGSELELDDFESPSWALKTAYRNGQRSMLRKLHQLIPF